jgi:peptidoglycan DL-endopeptidase CwlO
LRGWTWRLPALAAACLAAVAAAGPAYARTLPDSSHGAASARQATRGQARPRAAAGISAPSGRVTALTSPYAVSAVAPLRHLRQADVLVVAPKPLPAATAGRLRRLSGVTAAQPADAARIRVNGTFIAMLGVDPSGFRGFAAGPTARSNGLWRNVADGGIALSYTMGSQDKVKLGHPVKVDGARTERLRVGGFGTVGISGVDAVVSDPVARSLGIPAGNAIVISAPHADLSTLIKRIKRALPRRAEAVPLVAQRAVTGTPAAAGTAGAAGAAGSASPGAVGAVGATLSRAELIRFLTAAESRVGMPYVWGAAGPRAFDCSGLVQWSLAQAGVVMPRVAAAQAMTGPRVPVRDLRPGDLLFYHTDPTAPDYISHVAIYIGNGEMEQAPEPGMDVQIVPADTGNEFAGAIQIDPKIAASAAASPVG